MKKVPTFAKVFAGRWHIVEMDQWDEDFLDLIEEAHLTFEGAASGVIAFGAVKGFLDVRYDTRDGSACAEFSWAVFIVWHGAHKGCRFATSCAPPSARGAMWSACHPGCRSNLHVAHRCSNRYESASRSARMSPRRATIFAPKKKLDERGSPVGDFPFSPAFF